jgi:hypothetical protein
MRRSLLNVALLLLSLPGALWAQPVLVGSEPAKQVHWAVGAFFGTGWYRVDKNRSVYILRIPPRQTLRTASLDLDGNRQVGVEIQYPVALGLSKLDSIPDFVEFENYSTVSFTPGVHVEVPIDDRWSLRPYAHFGYGWEAESEEGALIWYGGIKSRYRVKDEGARCSVLNGLSYAGFKPQFEDRGHYGAVMAGLECGQPLGSVRPGGVSLFLNWHLTYNWYFDRLNFHVDQERVESIRDQWELGLALGKGGSRMKVWFLRFEQIGLGLRWSSNGDLKAITLNFRSPFTY